MPYELIGEEDYLVGDEDEGSIGADDDAFLNALVSGAGTSEILGAARRTVKQCANRTAQLAAKNAAAVVSTTLQHRRRFPIGFVPTTVLAGAQANIPASPQNLFRPERLVVPSDIASDFGIVDCKVGNESQFVAGGEVPASVFSEVSIDTNVQFKTAEVGNQIILTVRNKSVNDLEFTAAMIGTAAR